MGVALVTIVFVVWVEVDANAVDATTVGLPHRRILFAAALPAFGIRSLGCHEEKHDGSGRRPQAKDLLSAPRLFARSWRLTDNTHLPLLIKA